MYKLILTLSFWMLTIFSVSAQLRLDVEGDAKIVGKLDLSSGFENIFIGSGAGSQSFGGKNIFIGLDAGHSNDPGEGNIFIGYRTGELNYNGNYNCFLGSEAGFNNYYGASNSFF